MGQQLLYLIQYSYNTDDMTGAGNFFVDGALVSATSENNAIYTFDNYYDHDVRVIDITCVGVANGNLPRDTVLITKFGMNMPYQDEEKDMRKIKITHYGDTMNGCYSDEHFCISNIGSRKSTLTFYVQNQTEIRANTGRFDGTIEEFIDKVTDKMKIVVDKKPYKDYIRAIELAQQYFGHLRFDRPLSLGTKVLVNEKGYLGLNDDCHLETDVNSNKYTGIDPYPNVEYEIFKYTSTVKGKPACVVVKRNPINEYISASYVVYIEGLEKVEKD